MFAMAVGVAREKCPQIPNRLPRPRSPGPCRERSRTARKARREEFARREWPGSGRRVQRSSKVGDSSATSRGKRPGRRLKQAPASVCLRAIEADWRCAAPCWLAESRRKESKQKGRLGAGRMQSGLQKPAQRQTHVEPEQRAEHAVVVNLLAFRIVRHSDVRLGR